MPRCCVDYCTLVTGVMRQLRCSTRRSISTAVIAMLVLLSSCEWSTAAVQHRSPGMQTRDLKQVESTSRALVTRPDVFPPVVAPAAAAAAPPTPTAGAPAEPKSVDPNTDPSRSIPPAATGASLYKLEAAASASAQQQQERASSSQSLAATTPILCPSTTAQLSAAGCPCTWRLPVAQQPASSSTNSSSSSPSPNRCPAGYRCSPDTAAALVAAGWQQSSSASSSNMSFVPISGGVMRSSVTEAAGVCVPCQLGEFCPAGTQQETPTTLTACQENMNSPSGSSNMENNSYNSPSSLGLGTCTGYKPCPEGSVCRNASVIEPCEDGRFCTEGTSQSKLCSVENLLSWNPFRLIRPEPQLLLQSMVMSGQALDGNSCPAESSIPSRSCPAGSYCPTASEVLQCPEGYYCPSHSSAPQKCPVLADCKYPGQSAPDWSWLGLFMMLLMLVLLLIALEYLRAAGRRSNRSSTAEDEVMQLISSVGFQVASKQGQYIVHRKSSVTQYGTTRSESGATAGRFTRTRTLARIMVTKLMSRPFGSNVSATISEELPSHVTDDQAQAGSSFKSIDSDIQSATTSTAAATAAGGGNSQRLDFTVVNIGKHAKRSLKDTAQNHDQALAAPAKASTGIEEDCEDDSSYEVNPRLTLVFNDVWVADRPMDNTVRQQLKHRLKGFCLGHEEPENINTSHLGPHLKDKLHRKVDALTAKSDPAAVVAAKLTAAAAVGANFIVPGVSGKFAHSQLHAIMGPSGCGKTSLCKALAGRLPMSRVVGGITILCSSAYDGFKSESPLLADDEGAVSKIAPMMGFVPQFDLLHESLTVLENLEIAARLRMPLSINAQTGCCGTRTTGAARHKEIRETVDKAITLMALNKVAHQVVGTSSSRKVSGGQRKRAAIGVELVAKPCMLWLDEPTSGLDAAVASDVVEALKQSALMGMNVLAVMHQPRISIFNLFDSCLLLGGNGHVVYSGPQSLALAYMAFLGFYCPAGENAADFLLDVITGTVERPGDPDYIPSQLSTFWQKCGNSWVQQQQQRQLGSSDGHSTAQQSMLQPIPSLPVPAAPETAVVDWPWKPRQLEALLARFKLLVDAKRQQHGTAGGKDGDEAASVLTYEGFLQFWDEAGVRGMLGEEAFADFMDRLCDEFGMYPGEQITQAQFMEVLKSQLRAAAANTAAAAAAAAAVDPGTTGAVPNSAAGQLSFVTLHANQNAEIPQRMPTLGHDSAFAHASVPSFADTSIGSHPNEHIGQGRDSPRSQISDFESLPDTTAEPPNVGASPFSDLASVSCAELGAQQAQSSPAAAAAPALGQRNASAGAQVTPGVLTGPVARLQQRGMLRQASRRFTAGAVEGTTPAAVASFPSVSARSASSVLKQPGQVPVGRELSSQQAATLQKFRAAGKAVVAAGAKQRQTGGVGSVNSGSAGATPAVSLSLAEIANLVIQADRQASATGSTGAPGSTGSTAQPPPVAAAGKDVAAASGYELSFMPSVTSSADLTDGTGQPRAAAAPGSAAAVAAEAAVSSRKVPPIWDQLRVIVMRNGRKWVSSRTALMTDLLLTALLGIALGVAQGRNTDPGQAVLWLLITLLAYGCMSLARSTHSYGQERHLYLQLESQGGVAVTAWVFGHQIFDLIGLFLHPALFFAWLYVLTLSQVPAWAYYTVLVLVGWYTSGIGYLVSLAFPPRSALIAGLAAALLLGGVANGVAPRLWQLTASHPLMWLDQLSYTRWGLQALYISWLTPASAARAPQTAAFLSQLGFCGLEAPLWRSLQQQQGPPSSEAWPRLNSTYNGKSWARLTTAERADAFATVAMDQYRNATAPEMQSSTAAVAALTQLWQYYSRPELLDAQCKHEHIVALAVLLGLGFVTRLMVWLLVKRKVHKKAGE